MTPLVVAAAVVALLAVTGSFLRRGKDVRRSARRQQRALDTLGQISARRAVDPALPVADATRQAHVRVVAADAEPPLPAPAPLAGGWRPTRATGAAPFRQPGAPGAQRRPRPWPDAPEAAAAMVGNPVEPAASEEGVRLVSAGDPPPAVDAVREPSADAGRSGGTEAAREVAGSGHARRVPGQAPDVIGGLPTVDPPPPATDEAEDGGRDAETRAVAGAATAAIPAAGRSWASTDPGAAVDPPPGAEAGAVLRFDDVDPSPPPPRPEPAGPPAGVVGTPEERAEWAAKLAGAAGPRAASRRSSRHRHRARAYLAVAAAAIVPTPAPCAGGARLTGGPGRHGGRTPAAATTRPRPPATRPRSRSRAKRNHGDVPASSTTTSTSTTTPPPVQLVSSSLGMSVYQLSGPADVVISATGPCWVEVRSGGVGGPVVYTATMQSGQVESVAAPLWVRLGNPTAVAVSVNGDQLSPPVSPNVPYNLDFQ